MNKSRAIISILLVFVTILSIAGCGKKAEMPTTTEAAGTTTTVVNDDGSTTTTTTEPDGSTTTTTTNLDGSTTTTTTKPDGTTTTTTKPSGETTTKPSTETTTQSPSVTPDTPPTSSIVSADAKYQSVAGCIVVGTTIYETVGKVSSVVTRYINMVNKQADSLAGVANVYCLVIPKNIGITTELGFQQKVGSKDQKAILDDLYSRLNSNVKKVEIFDTMFAHRDEYLYFRTDHHWTARGAYYAYTQFTKVAGKITHPLSKYTEINCGKFLGYLYTTVNGQNTTVGAKVKANPDICYAYRPNANATMYYGSDEKNAKTKLAIVRDTSSWSISSKYLAFIGGDQAFCEITNPDITDGSSIVVIKESFGNAFAPFLVENYHKVYVIDYRHYKKSISAFVKNYGVQDVLYINNISAISASSLVGNMEARL